MRNIGPRKWTHGEWSSPRGTDVLATNITSATSEGPNPTDVKEQWGCSWQSLFLFKALNPFCILLDKNKLLNVKVNVNTLLEINIEGLKFEKESLTGIENDVILHGIGSKPHTWIQILPWQWKFTGKTTS